MADFNEDKDTEVTPLPGTDTEVTYAGSFIMTMASAASNIDFFRDTLSDDACANWRVTINDVVSEQKANNLTFSANDVIKIEYDTNSCVFHPGEMDADPTTTLDYILKIEGSLPSNDNSEEYIYLKESIFDYCSKLVSVSGPLFSNWVNATSFFKCFKDCTNLSSISEDIFKYNTTAAEFSQCFLRCYSLTSIPEDLFKYNTDVTYNKFYRCFEDCQTLTSIPENLFSENIKANSFSTCFCNCTGLTSVPEKLFYNNTEVTSFLMTFDGCSNLTPVLYISSDKVVSAIQFAYDCASKGTVYVLKDSTTYTTFSSASNANVNVLTWNQNTIDISDTPLTSMVLVDDDNNRTTFNGPIITDFTITEELQGKIDQLTTLATDIGNLQTRLTNIINVLNTQNIEFTDNITDVSSAGSKLYIQPKIYLKLVKSDSTVRYLNLTPYLTGKYNFASTYPSFSLNVTCSLGLDSDFNASDWACTLGPNSLTDLTVSIAGGVEDISSILVNSYFMYSNYAIEGTVATITDTTQINIGDYSGNAAFINITFTK